MLGLGTLLAATLMSAAPAISPPATDSSQMTLVVVQNDRTVPVAVYAQDAWGELELGVVPPDSTVTLRVDDPFLDRSDIDFFVHPKGQPEEETGYLDIHRGDRLGILVPPR